jgi:hypothetical protein
MASTPVRLTIETDTIEVEHLAGALTEFSAFLAALDVAMSAKGRRTLIFRVTSLSYNSPPEVGIAIESRASGTNHGPAVLRRAVQGIQELETGRERPLTLPYEALDHLRRLAGYARQPKERVLFDSTSLGVSGVVTATLGKKADRVLARGDALGSIEGQLETVSVHGQQSFTIYDAVTGRGVRCYFPEGMFARAVAALGKRAIVSGRIRRDPFGVPREIRDVSNLHVPGAAGPYASPAGAYRGLDVRAYLAEIRGE